MDDLISKQQAIDALKPCAGVGNRVLDKLRALPSAEPTVEPKNGKWIEDAKTYYEQLNERGLGVDEYTPYFTDDIACSVCLAKYSTIDNETQFFKFCPNCGADMRGEHDG